MSIIWLSQVAAHLKVIPTRLGLHVTQPNSTPPAVAGFDYEENEAKIQALIELIATGEAIALVGAGISVAAGYESWPGFLGKLEARAKEIRPGFSPGPQVGDSRDYLTLAQRIRDHIADPSIPSAREKWYDEIGKLFSRDPATILDSLTALHRDLVQLPFRAFLTTNIENVLEVALKEYHPARPQPEWVAVWNGNDLGLLSRAVRGIAATDGAGSYVLHLHGMYRAGSSLILCADEYAAAYGLPELAFLEPRSPDSLVTRQSSPGPTRLFLLTVALLATRRVVFLGFSLNDVYFTEVLRRVSDLLWEWQTATHFALMPFEPDKASEQLLRAEEIKSRSGIETVFYPVIGGDYGALDSLIARISKEVDARRSIPQPLRSKTESASQMPEWVSRNNAAQLASLALD